MSRVFPTTRGPEKDFLTNGRNPGSNRCSGAANGGAPRGNSPRGAYHEYHTPTNNRSVKPRGARTHARGVGAVSVDAGRLAFLGWLADQQRLAVVCEREIHSAHGGEPLDVGFHHAP